MEKETVFDVLFHIMLGEDKVSNIMKKRQNGLDITVFDYEHATYSPG